MSKIIITRKQEWNNRLRQIGIYLDGQKIGTIANGETKSFDVPSGNHALKAKIGWCGSREIELEVAGEEKKYFSLRGFRYSNIMLPFVIVLVLLNIFLRKIYANSFVLWLTIPVFLLLIYYLTIGRNDYLRLTQEETW
jgi:hypothetical protein